MECCDIYSSSLWCYGLLLHQKGDPVLVISKWQPFPADICGPHCADGWTAQGLSDFALCCEATAEPGAGGISPILFLYLSFWSHCLSLEESCLCPWVKSIPVTLGSELSNNLFMKWQNIKMHGNATGILWLLVAQQKPTAEQSWLYLGLFLHYFQENGKQSHTQTKLPQPCHAQLKPGPLACPVWRTAELFLTGGRLNSLQLAGRATPTPDGHSFFFFKPPISGHATL